MFVVVVTAKPVDLLLTEGWEDVLARQSGGPRGLRHADRHCAWRRTPMVESGVAVRKETRGWTKHHKLWEDIMCEET